MGAVVRLAIVRRRYARFGGAERFIDTIAAELDRAGIGLSIVTESWHGSSGSVRQIAVPSGGITRRGKLAHFQREVAAVVAREKFDLVQTHERLLTADIFRAGDGVHAAWLARLAAEQGPWRAAIRRLDGMHRLIVDTERKMARETDMIFVANSALVAREIAQWLDVPNDRIRTIENGVDTVRFHPPSPAQRAAARKAFGLDIDMPVVAFVGSGFQRKGAFSLVEALALPECRDIHALIAGRDRQADVLRRRVETTGLANRVRLLGGVADPVAVYHAADVFALPSLYDPMPNAALEALACGVPLALTADTGTADVIQGSGAGEIVTRRPESIARGLLSILRAHGQMAAKAAALESRFDAAAATARWMALYRELT
jgi:UDP-glucose:(heptosyl)LPS alpha-1,3-glucosyltransferase